jgi:hypothetical protein
MARVTAPLMSIAATGTIGPTLAFRISAGVQLAQNTPGATPRPSDRQTAQRDAFRAAATHWQTLAADHREPWATLSSATGRHARQNYITEWLRQRATPDNPPLIPVAGL